MANSNESIFKTLFRSFFKGFFTISGFFIAIIIGIMIIGGIIASKEISSNKTSIEILPDLNGSTTVLPSKTPVILQIDINGPIGMAGNNTKDEIETILIDSRKNTLANNRVKAVLVKLFTPGGTIIDSDGIYHALKNYKTKYNVPIYAYVDGMSASGGMYIMSAADKIFASDISLVGSVGVRMGTFINVVDTLEKIGMKTANVTNGKNKDSFNPFRPWSKDEGKHLYQISDFFYEKFISIVSQARPKLTPDKLKNVYGANVYSAPLAEKYGYIDDGKSSYEKALKSLMSKAGIDETKPYQIVKLKTKRKLINELFENSAIFKGKINHEISLTGEKDQIKDKLSYLYNM